MSADSDWSMQPDANGVPVWSRAAASISEQQAATSKERLSAAELDLVLAAYRAIRAEDEDEFYRLAREYTALRDSLSAQS